MHHLLILRIAVLLASALLPGPSLQAPNPRQNVNVKRSYGISGLNQTFDYVIVGGGTAGLTIASRLAEDSSLDIAVIEAGGFYEDNGNTSIVPGYDSVYTGTDPADTNPNIDWGYVTVPQTVSIGKFLHATYL